MSTRLEMLEAENAELRERIALLESERGAGLVMPVEWMLTGCEQRLLALLLSREQATKDALLTAMARPDVDNEPEIKIVDVFVCKIRRKMAPFELTIRTIFGRGYAIDEPQRSLFRARCRGVSPSPQPRTAARSAAQDRPALHA